MPPEKRQKISPIAISGRAEICAKIINMLKIYKIIVGSIQTNCYVVARQSACVIIDPGDEAGKIIDAIKKTNLKPECISLTHSHFDHTGAVEELKKELNIQVSDPSFFEVIETPGHTKDGVCFVEKNSKVIFTGDTLFKGSIGRTDLPGGNYAEMKKSLQRLMDFSDDFKIYPGHGEESTVGEERKHNPFLR